MDTKVNIHKIKSNIWEYPIGSGVSSDKNAHQHPAIYPENLVYDHIISWSNIGDLILDPFAGSGTSGIVAINTGRNCILIEKEPEYWPIIEKRINI